MKQIIHVDGWPGVGKSTLCRLLDGHSEVVSFPVQDNLIGAFPLCSDSEKVLAYRDSTLFRKLLAAYSGYYRWERDALAGVIPLALDKHTVLSWPFRFDFYDLDRDCRMAIESESTWTAETIVNLIYDRIPLHWRDFMSKGREASRCVCMGENIPEAVSFLVESIPNAKCIYVLRSPEGIISTRGSRVPHRARDVGSNEAQGFMTVDYLIEGGIVERILAFQDYVRRIAELHQDRVLLLDFEDMLERHVDTMHRVADFLDMAYEPILERFTIVGEEVTLADGRSFVGKVNDNPDVILSRSQLDEIEKRRRAYVRQTAPSWMHRQITSWRWFCCRCLRGLEWRLRP